MALIQDAAGFVKGLVMPFLNNVVIAVLTFFIGLIVGRILGKLVFRLMHVFHVDKTLQKAVGAKVSVEGLAEISVSYVTYLIFLIFALNQLGLTQKALYIVAGVAGMVAVIAGVLAVKDVLPNAIAGFVIMRRAFPKVGDRVRIDNVVGKVAHVAVLETRVKTAQGDVISFPNRQILKSRLERLAEK